MAKEKPQPQWTLVTPHTKIEFTYTNHAGKTEHRMCEFLGIDYGSNDWYPEPQFFIRCKADDRDGAERSFAIAKIKGETFRKTDMTW